MEASQDAGPRVGTQAFCRGRKPAAVVTEQDMGPDVKNENESPLRLFDLQKSGHTKALCPRKLGPSQGQNLTLRV